MDKAHAQFSFHTSKGFARCADYKRKIGRRRLWWRGYPQEIKKQTVWNVKVNTQARRCKRHGRGDATTVALYNKLYPNTMDNKKATIIIPEPLRKAVNPSMITGDQDFLICQISSSGEGIMWESAELHRELVGRLSQKLLRLHTCSDLHEYTASGLREMCSCGTNWNDLGSYCLPSEPCSQTMWASLMCFCAKPARLSLSCLQQWLKGTLLSTLKCLWPIGTVCYGVWVQEVAALAPYNEGK